MKKLFFLLLILCYTAFGFSQSDFELSLTPAYGTASADEDDFLAHSMIKNLTDETIVIAWQRVLNDIPEDWESYICSDVTCAPPDISMGTFSLTANDSTNFDIHFLPHDLSGMGTVEIKFFLTDDLSQETSASYFGNANPVNTTNLVRNKIKVYPNPASDRIIIDHQDDYSVDLFSIFGKHIKTFNNINRINISALKNGSYFLRIHDQEKKLISINLFQKIDN